MVYAKIKAAGRTDIGKRRDSNQDQFLIADLNKSMLIESSSLKFDCQTRLYGASYARLLMVADGMGGHQAGSHASLLALDLLINQLVNGMHWPAKSEVVDEERFIERLKKLFESAHQQILKESEAKPELNGMGTTLTMAYIMWPAMYVVHVGDSRCYLVREGKAEQITTDHTLSNQFAKQSKMSEESAELARWSHVLYNALGAGGIDVNVEVHKVGLQVDDAVVLCTDGLYRYVKAGELADLLLREIEVAEACRSLIDLANFRGGHDNITAVVARCIESSGRDRARTIVATEMTLERALGGFDSFDESTASSDTDEFQTNVGTDTLDYPSQ